MNTHTYPRINRSQLSHVAITIYEYRVAKLRMSALYLRINCSQNYCQCVINRDIQSPTYSTYHIKVFSFHLLSPDSCGLNEKLNLHSSYAYINTKSLKPPKYSVDSYGLNLTTETVNHNKSESICIFTADENSNTEQKKLLNAYWTTHIAEGDPLYSMCFLDENSYYKFTPRPSYAALDKHCFTQCIKAWNSHRYLAVPTFMSVAKPALNVTVKQCLSSAAGQLLTTGAALLVNPTLGVKFTFSFWETKTRLGSRWGMNFDDCWSHIIKTRLRAICLGANTTLKSIWSTCLALIATERPSISSLSSDTLL